MDQLKLALTESSVKHLSNSANSLLTTAGTNALKSYYLTKCRTMTLSGAITLPQRFSKTTIRCPKCCVQYEDGPASYQIQPGRKKNRFVCRLLKRSGNGRSLTRFQEIYFKKLLSKEETDNHNALVITCGICKTEIKEKLKKPKKELIIETVEDNPKPRKKKKKKDRFSGLNKNAVLSATPQDKLCSTIKEPLQVTPLTNTNSVKKNVCLKKKLFAERQEKNKKIEESRKKRKDIKEKHKNLKGLNNFLNNSKQKGTPSSALKKFLTSI